MMREPIIQEGFQDFRVRVRTPNANMRVDAASIHQSLRSAGDRLHPDHAIEVEEV
jgi:hypothetical protein